MTNSRLRTAVLVQVEKFLRIVFRLELLEAAAVQLELTERKEEAQAGDAAFVRLSSLLRRQALGYGSDAVEVPAFKRPLQSAFSKREMTGGHPHIPSHLDQALAG